MERSGPPRPHRHWGELLGFLLLPGVEMRHAARRQKRGEEPDANSERSSVDAATPTVRCLLERLLRRYELQQRPILKSARSHAKALIERLGDLDARDLDTEALERYVEARLAEGRAPKTCNNEMQLLRRALRLASRTKVGRRWLVDPRDLPHIDLLPKRLCPRRTRYLTDSEYDRLEAALPPHLAALARFLRLTGFRIGEALRLKWEHVDMGQRWIEIPASKNGDPASYPVTTAILAVLLGRWPERNGTGHVFTRRGKPIKNPRHAWGTAVARAGLKDVQPHDLRRTWTRNLLDTPGVDPRAVIALGNWRDGRVALDYIHRSRTELREAAERLTRRSRGA